MSAVKGTVKVTLHHGIPLVRRHFVDRVDPEHPGVIDQDIQPAPGIDGSLDYPLRSFRFGDAVITGDRFTAGLFYCLSGILQRRGLDGSDSGDCQSIQSANAGAEDR